MELQELIKKVSTINFEQLINSRDRSCTKLYKDSKKSLKLYTSEISEQFMLNNLDKYYSKLDISCWVLQIPYTLNNIKNETHIQLLMKEGYLKNEEKDKLSSLFLNINNSNFYFKNVFFIEYDNFLNFKITEYYKENNNLYKRQYLSFNFFMKSVYKVDVSNNIQSIFDNISLNKYKNYDFKDYTNCMIRNNYDDLNTRINLIIYQDLFNMLPFKVYLTNIDAILKDKNGEFALLEMKSKSQSKYVYINENEFKLYQAFLDSFKIVFYIMMSLNQEDTMDLLIKRDIVFGDSEFYYYVLNKKSLNYINIETINNKENVAKIPLKFFNRIHTIELDEMINHTIQNYTNCLLNLYNTAFPINDYEKELKKIIISEFKRVHIIHSLFELEIENYKKRGTSIFHILNSNKKIVTRYITDRAWRISIDEDEINDYKQENVDYIIIVKLYPKTKNGGKIDILGYISLDDYVKYSNKCAKLDNIRSNNGFLNFCKLNDNKKLDLMNQEGITFVLFLNENNFDYNRCRNLGISIKPYHPLKKLDENSVFDLGVI